MTDSIIHKIAVSGYRSIRNMVLPLEQLNVITGPNGCGKTNFYRALKLLSDIAQGQLLASFAREGGFSSVLWAGPEKVTREMRIGQVPVEGSFKREKPISLRVGLEAEPYSYSIDLGLPPKSALTLFNHDPEIKREMLWRGKNRDSKFVCADRRASSLRCRGTKAGWQQVDIKISSRESMLTEFADPFSAPELIAIRDLLKSWRFYDGFRVDTTAPCRQICHGTQTTCMAGDGSDFAAAFQTILEIGNGQRLQDAIEQAFPGSKAFVSSTAAGLLFSLRQRGVLRELAASELSDGTLRFLLLATALLTLRPPSLMILNEPESSLHPDLIPALGELILDASKQTQMIVVTHSESLVVSLQAHPECNVVRLAKSVGETQIEGACELVQRGWNWPSR